MRLAYFDAFSGLAGDMIVGALLDCGLEIAALEAELAKLPLEGYTIRLESRERSGIRAAKFVVEIDGVPASSHSHVEHGHYAHEHPHGHDHSHASSQHPHRSFHDIRELIRASDLSPRVCELSLQVFARLAEAEGKVHGMDPEEVRFHEVGAVDSIVDIVGTAWAVAALDIGDIVVSPLPLGRGMIHTAHGALPVPGPATVELLRGFPVRVGDGEGEMVTPTGAAIVAALGRPGAMPQELVVEKIGYGAGDREFHDRPNLLRVLLGTTSGEVGADSLLLLETNLDDLNPELYEYVMERLFAAGARDVFLTPIQMKKGRPGTLVSVLCDPDKRDVLSTVIFAETSTLGLRVLPVTRLHLEREIREVTTRFGRVRVKIARGPNGALNVAPEYEDCKRAAAASGAPRKTVYQEATAAALRDQNA
jgi:pyridinium-3,5-bisthiocarboxylic acid mononucleotide nickel chelatase